MRYMLRQKKQIFELNVMCEVHTKAGKTDLITDFYQKKITFLIIETERVSVKCRPGVKKWLSIENTR